MRNKSPRRNILTGFTDGFRFLRRLRLVVPGRGCHQKQVAILTYLVSVLYQHPRYLQIAFRQRID